MSIATLTSKGQITIPAGIRAKLRLSEGSRVDFRPEADGTVRLVPLTKTVAEVAGMLWRPGTKTVAAEDMRALAGEALANEWKRGHSGRANGSRR
jgi:AbrB family looped-hinge helix DNA binding protein